MTMIEKTESGHLSTATLKRYRAHSRRWEQSGLSQTEYCRRHHLSYNTFGYVRNKVLKEHKELPVDKSFIPLKASPAQAATNISSSAHPSSQDKFSLRLRTGHVLEWPASLSSEQLKNLFAALGVQA